MLKPAVMVALLWLYRAGAVGMVAGAVWFGLRRRVGMWVAALAVCVVAGWPLAFGGWTVGVVVSSWLVGGLVLMGRWGRVAAVVVGMVAVGMVWLAEARLPRRERAIGDGRVCRVYAPEKPSGEDRVVVVRVRESGMFDEVEASQSITTTGACQ